MEEIWKPIPGFEGLYDASSAGRIRSTPGKTTSSTRFEKRVWKSRVMKVKSQARGNGINTDYRVELWKDKQHKTYLVARLVAMAFHGVPDIGMTVNHINGIPTDNRPENLEWVTSYENNRHAHRTGLCASYEHPVGLIDNCCDIHLFRSEAEACRWIGRNTSYIYTRKLRGYSTAVNAEGKTFKIIPVENYWRENV